MSEQQQQQKPEGPKFCDTCLKKNYKAEIGFHQIGTRPDGKGVWFIYDWGTNNEHKHVSQCKFCNQNIRWAQEDGKNVPKELDGVTNHRPNCTGSQEQPTTTTGTTNVVGTGTSPAQTTRLQQPTGYTSTSPTPTPTTNPIQESVQNGNLRLSPAENEILTHVKRVEQLIIGNSPESMASKFSALTDGVNAFIDSVENWMQDIQKKTVDNPFTAASKLEPGHEQTVSGDIQPNNEPSRELEPETKKIFEDLEREGKEAAENAKKIYADRFGNQNENTDNSEQNVSN